MTPMLQELDDYYRRRGIHPQGFRCCCRDACASTTNRFTEAKSAFVGTRYEDRSAGCCLLFLGLDPGEGEEWSEPEQRTPEAIQQKIESDRPGDNQHWWGTLRFALRILSIFDDKLNKLYEDLESDYGDCRLSHKRFLNRKQTEFQLLVTPSFAHANAVRCSVNAKNKKQASPILYANCQKYLCEELEILRPDIIVTQGDDAKEGLRRCAQEIAPHANCKSGCQPNCSERCKLVLLGGRKVLWICTYHPSQGAGLFVKEGGPSWNCYAGAAKAFMNQTPRESDQDAHSS